MKEIERTIDRLYIEAVRILTKIHVPMLMIACQ